MLILLFASPWWEQKAPVLCDFHLPLTARLETGRLGATHLEPRQENQHDAVGKGQRCRNDPKTTEMILNQLDLTDKIMRFSAFIQHYLIPSLGHCAVLTVTQMHKRPPAETKLCQN